MKKTIFTIAILFSLFSIVLTSCKKDDEPETPAASIFTGNYEINLDGALFHKGTNVEVGRIQDDQGNFVNNAGISTNEINIIVSQFPRTIGDDVAMDTDADPGVLITFDQDVYGTISGTLTRTSAKKVSFNGMCKNIHEAEEFTITGFVESEAWEVID